MPSRFVPADFDAGRLEVLQKVFDELCIDFDLPNTENRLRGELARTVVAVALGDPGCSASVLREAVLQHMKQRLKTASSPP